MLQGIDVSHHNPVAKLHWDALRAEGVEFCIARACYGVASDKAFPDHVKAARAGGAKAGAYLFYRQTQGRQEQLDAFVAEMDRVGIGPGDIAPTVDLEWNTAYDGRVNPAKFNGDARWLVEQLALKYGRCICYFAPGFFELLGSPPWLRDHPWWLCHYTSKPEPWVPKGAPDWVIWQHRGGTFRDAAGVVTLKGGRLQGYGNGSLDIDLNRARSLPLIDAMVPSEDEVVPVIEDGGSSLIGDTEPAPPPSESDSESAVALAAQIHGISLKLVQKLGGRP